MTSRVRLSLAYARTVSMLQKRCGEATAGGTSPRTPCPTLPVKGSVVAWWDRCPPPTVSHRTGRVPAPVPCFNVLRICFLGALNPPRTTSKKPASDRNSRTGRGRTSIRTTVEDTLGRGLNAPGRHLADDPRLAVEPGRQRTGGSCGRERRSCVPRPPSAP